MTYTCISAKIKKFTDDKDFWLMRRFMCDLTPHST